VINPRTADGAHGDRASALVLAVQRHLEIGAAPPQRPGTGSVWEDHQAAGVPLTMSRLLREF
jgi:hypothetical protein